MKYKIYLLTLIGDEFNRAYYIGKTINVNERRLKHLSDLRINDHHSFWLQHFWCEFNCTDKDLTLTVMDSSDDVTEANKIEMDYISQNYGIYNLCNVMGTGAFNYERSLIIKDIWKDPEYRERISVRRKETWRDPEYRENIIGKMKDRWKDPKYREMMSEKSREINSCPLLRKRHSEIGKKRWQDKDWVNSRKEFYASYTQPISVPIIINNKEYKSIANAGEILGIPPRTIHDRLHSTDPLFRHYLKVDTPDKKLNWDRVFVINGQLYFDIMTIAKEYNISHPSVRRRVKNKNLMFLGWEDWYGFKRRVGEDEANKFLMENHGESPLISL